MKLLRYGEPGLERPGLWDGTQIRDVSRVVRDIDGEFFARGGASLLHGVDIDSLPIVDPGCRIGPCIGDPGKFVCVGLNYAEHASESSMKVPAEPVLFMKATSSLAGPNDVIRRPPGAMKLDWEVELAVIVGRPLRECTRDDAASSVGGYCVVNDVSERSFQLEGTGQWLKGKSADTFGPIGPWLVTEDEVGTPHALSIWLEVNGRRVQNSSTASMIWHVPDLLAYISRFMTLHPGDIVSTGTPQGVGMGFSPPRYLQPGDVVELGVDGLGRQRHVVVDA